MFDAVQKERPESWPHGIGFHLFDKSANENVYLVRHKQSSVPVGFVGWQERKEAGQRVGYYSVGIMPEFRGQHFAKEALTKLIRIKSAGVDAVKALVQKDNAASIGLAESIGVPVIKCASYSMAEKQAINAKPFVEFLKSHVGSRLARGAAGAAVADAGVYGADKISGADEWADPSTRLKQYSEAAVMGGMAAQPGVKNLLVRYMNPKKQVGGAGLLARKLGLAPDVAPTLVRAFSPGRAAALATLPGLAWGMPLLIHQGNPPLAKMIGHDLPADYQKELEARNTTPKDYSLLDYGKDQMAERIGKKMAPVAERIGNRAVDKVTPILKDNLQGMISAGKEVGTTAFKGMVDNFKPHAAQFSRDVAVPLGLSVLGGMAGDQLGKLTYQDDPKLTFDERFEKKKKQQRMRILLGLALGTAGGTASYIKDLPGMLGNALHKGSVPARPSL